MTSLTSKHNPIVVDRSSGMTSGSTRVSYTKTLDERLWIRSMPGGTWETPNLFSLIGTATAETKGDFPITLRPGSWFDAVILGQDQEPIDDQFDPLPPARLTVPCVWLVPEQSLIVESGGETGGTWHEHGISTVTTTSIARIGASRSPIVLDGNGMPIMAELDGWPQSPLTTSGFHAVQLAPLLAGCHYWFAVMVTDEFGNWDVLQDEFNTLARELTVGFDTLHIFNDGDSGTHGEGEFWFRVEFHPDPWDIQEIESFHQPEMDIDDWSETDRPYSLNASFKHNGLSQRVHDGEMEVYVASWAKEDDSPFGYDAAGFPRGEPLGLPAGKGKEAVSNRPFRIDCPPSNDGSAFHYAVDGRWSVKYVP
ncbi:MAG: hypothetical protein WBA46_03025 [Thermomicrobiales bacterium]